MENWVIFPKQVSQGARQIQRPKENGRQVARSERALEYLVSTHQGSASCLGTDPSRNSSCYALGNPRKLLCVVRDLCFGLSLCLQLCCLPELGTPRYLLGSRSAGNCSGTESEGMRHYHHPSGPSNREHTYQDESGWGRRLAVLLKLFKHSQQSTGENPTPGRRFSLPSTRASKVDFPRHRLGFINHLMNHCPPYRINNK